MNKYLSQWLTCIINLELVVKDKMVKMVIPQTIFLHNSTTTTTFISTTTTITITTTTTTIFTYSTSQPLTIITTTTISIITTNITTIAITTISPPHHHHHPLQSSPPTPPDRAHSGSVVRCLTRDRGVAGSSQTASLCCGPWARHIYPSLALVQHRKTHPCLTERFWWDVKNQIKQKPTPPLSPPPPPLSQSPPPTKPPPR